MRTVITANFAAEMIIPALLCIWFLGRCLLHRVYGFLDEADIPALTCRQGKHVPAALWIFTLFCLLAILSPSPPPDKIIALLFLAFLLQAGVTDAVSGYMPLTFTGRFLVAGLLAGMPLPLTPELLMSRAAGVTITGVVMMAIDKVVNRNGEKFGRGDMWLIAAFTAWEGFQNATIIAAGGLMAFLCWHLSLNSPGKKEGPVGPWLCVSGGIYLLDKLYNPVWINIS